MVKLRESSAEIAARPDKIERLVCLDALRGLFLLILVSAGFGLREPNQEMLNADRWGWLINEFAHRDPTGCSIWDLLLPALLFCAGVAMPISYINRQNRGQSWARQLLHALLRASILVVLGLYLESYRQNRLVFELRGDLQMIALAWLLAFLILPAGMPAQGVTVGFLLVGSTAAYVIYALASGQDLWSPTHSAGASLDAWLGFAPHPQKLVTLNLLTWTAIVMLGNLVGGLLRTGLTPGVKVAIMTGSSIFAILFGWLLGGGNGWIDLSWYALIPIMRSIATWTFAFTAVGWTLLLFTYLYLITDGFLLRAWALPLTVFGRNALILYLTFELFHEWAKRSAGLVLPAIVGTLKPLFASLIVLAIYWLFCFWLYRRRIFLKV